MTQFLNQIFYPCKQFDDFESLKRLDKYIVNVENMNLFLNSVSKKFEEIKSSPIVKEIVPIVAPIAPIVVPIVAPIMASIIVPIVVPIVAPIIASIIVPIVYHNIESKKKRDPIFYPRCEDSLFWSIFIAFHGMKEYEYIGKKYANRELEEKQKIMEHFKKNPSSMKQMNFKVTNVLLQEILSDLMTNKKTSLATFLAFVSYYKKRVFIVRKNTYLMYNFETLSTPSSSTEFIRTTTPIKGSIVLQNSGFQVSSPEKDISEDMNFVILHYNPETKSYGIDTEITQEKVANILDTKCRLSGFLKPLRGVSTYKVEELEEMGNKMGLTWYPKIKKNELFELINNEALWV